MWLGLAVYFALIALRTALNYRALRRYLKLPLIERPAPPEPLPSVREVLRPAGRVDADTDWLLFTVPSVRHEPKAVEKMASFVVERRAQAMAVILHEQCATVWERLLLPFSAQQSFISAAALEHAGHEVLVERAAYRRPPDDGPTGSVEAIAAEARSNGRAALVARAEGLGSVRSYQSASQLWAGAGWRLLHGGLPTLLGLALSILAIPCAVYGLFTHSLPFELAALVTWLISFSELALWQFIFQAPVSYALLQPLAAVLAWVAVLRAALAR
jgi:hypothetical protein